MKVTRLNRSNTTWTTVPLAFGYLFVSVLNAFAGMTANVVSILALAMVPFRAVEPALIPVGNFSCCFRGESSSGIPGGRAVAGVRPRSRGDEAAGRMTGPPDASGTGDGDLVAGKDEDMPSRAVVSRGGDRESCLKVLCRVFAEDDLRRTDSSLAYDMVSGLATRLLPIISCPIWLTSESALALFLLLAALSRSESLELAVILTSALSSSSLSASSSNGDHASFMSSVKRERMEKSEERVPPVETSLRRWYPLNEVDSEAGNRSGLGGDDEKASEEGAN